MKSAIFAAKSMSIKFNYTELNQHNTELNNIVIIKQHRVNQKSDFKLYKFIP